MISQILDISKKVKSLKKIVWTLGPVLSLFFSQQALISDRVFQTIMCVQLEPFNPYPLPYQTMLRGPTKKLTTWLLSTLFRGKEGQTQ